MRIAFRFRLIPFVATVLLVALGVALGQWQDRRADAKIAIQDKLSARASAGPVIVGSQLLPYAQVEYRTVKVAGQFVSGFPIFLDNRPLGGKTGYYLVMPFKIAGSDTHVLVTRGWLPRKPGEHDQRPDFATPAGTVVVTGVAKASMARVMQLGQPAAVKPQALLQNIDPAGFAAATGLTVQPFFIEQSEPAVAGDDMVRDWPAPALGVDKHRGYAFQWYALAVMALLFFVFTGFKREPT